MVAVMGEGRHTPGPWRQSEEGGCTIYGNLPSKPKAIAVSQYQAPEINRANARLIAAAPDLLSAAKRIGGELATAYHEKRRLTRDEMFALMSWAVAAVAKAEPFDPSPSEAHAHG